MRAALCLWLLVLFAACARAPSTPAEQPAAPDTSAQAGKKRSEIVFDEDRPFARLHYSDLAYCGAFRLPDSDEYAYGEGAVAYIAPRNTLAFITQNEQFVELTIPAPIICPGEEIGELNAATEVAVAAALWSNSLSPMLGRPNRASGLAWFDGRLWLAAYESYNAAALDNLGICSMDDTFGDPGGAWRVGPTGINQPIDRLFHANKTHEYILVIPQSWSERYAPGKRLAAGRHREAGTLGGGNGPALFAFEANATAPAGAHLNGIPLMAFPFQDDMTADYFWPPYTAKDEFAAIWLEVGKRQAVVIGAMQGIGPVYYGLSNTCLSNKGYHSEPYEPRLYFIDVNQLARVARRKAAPWSPRPYETVSPREVWLHPEKPGNDPTCKRDWFADFAYDAAGQRLFAVQVNAWDRDHVRRSIVHVWHLR